MQLSILDIGMATLFQPLNIQTCWQVDMLYSLVESDKRDSTIRHAWDDTADEGSIDNQYGLSWNLMLGMVLRHSDGTRELAYILPFRVQHTSCMPLQAWKLMSEAILFLPCRNKYAFCGVLESGFCLWECVVSDVHLLKGYHTHTLTKTSTFWGCYCRLDVYNLRSISKMYCYDQTGCQDKAFQKHSGNGRRESNEEVTQLDATSSSTFWQIKNVRHEHDATSLLICLPTQALVSSISTVASSIVRRDCSA